MEGIVHIRIDARMIHGQVAVMWSNYLRVNRIMVANDAVAEDEITKSALRIDVYKRQALFGIAFHHLFRRKQSIRSCRMCMKIGFIPAFVCIK